jgi:hypothetical protein
MAKRKGSIRNFESILDEGENASGFTAQTPNGTSKAMGVGWNQSKPLGTMPAEPGGAWQPGRSNRTGE